MGILLLVIERKHCNVLYEEIDDLAASKQIAGVCSSVSSRGTFYKCSHNHRRQKMLGCHEK